MTQPPDALDFARRQAIRKADDAKQLDTLLADVLRVEADKLLGQAWLSGALDAFTEADGLPPTEEEFMILSVWLMYHYRSPATNELPFAAWWADRKRLYREPAKARLVQAHCNASIGLWEVMQVERGLGTHLRDLISGEEVFVLDRSSSATLERWLVLCGYVVQVDGIAFFGGVHQQPLVPSDADRVVKAARKLARTRRKAIGIEHRSHPEFQSAVIGCWRIVVEQVLSPRAVPTMHNTDGDLLEPQRDEFAIRAPVTHLLEALANVPGAQEAKRVGRATEVVIIRPERTDEMIPGGTVVGNITVTKTRLRIDTNSVARADALRAAVEHVAGELLTWRARVSEDIGAALEEARRPTAGTPPPRGGSPAFSSLDDPSTMPPEIRAHLAAMGEQEKVRWPDYPLPALDGMTARAAARDQRMRPRLVLLLKDMEARQATAPFPNPLALDFTRLRRELGV
jgi:hypothetical protein